MAILALIGEFVLPFLFPVCRPSSLNCDPVADGGGLVYQLRQPIFNGRAVQNWCTASFCLSILQVLANSVNLLEAMFTRKVLNSVIALTRRVSRVAVSHLTLC